MTTMKPTLSYLEDVVIDAALTAGRILRDRAFDIYDIREKPSLKASKDYVTELDELAERTIREIISNETESVNFLGEEYGFQDAGSDITMYIDPIDGTKSYIRGLFESSLSIGVAQDKKLVGGIVYDFMRDVLYAGWDGRSYRRVRGNNILLMHNNPIGTDAIFVNDDDTSGYMERLIDHGYKPISKSGSIALAMAQTAAGMSKGIIVPHSPKRGAWDIAGGMYLLEAQGFVFQTLEGGQFSLDNVKSGFLAYHPIHEQICKDVQEWMQKQESLF